MAKFNAQNTTNAVNQSGHAAYAMTDKDKLVSQILTTFFAEPKFYGDNSSGIAATAARVAADEPEFVSKLAVFARREFNMRSASHALTAILAHEPKGKPFVRAMLPAVVARADDMTEILSAYISMYGKPVPNSLKKGIGDAMKRFDEYALAKYKGEQNALKMRDVLRICHPSPKDEAQSDLWKRCVAKKLATPYTWESELSAKGNNKETWAGLIKSGRVNYMALLRNLRNIINAAPDNIDEVYKTISDPAQVKKSRQLPFRFFSAYKELSLSMGQDGNEGEAQANRVSGRPGALAAPAVTSKAFDALEAALDASVGNLPRIPGKTAIAVDVSGSMTWGVSRKSKMTCAEIAVLLGVMAARICDESIFYTFDTSLRQRRVSAKGGILAQARAIPVDGGGTDMSLPFKEIINRKINVDRIIVLSDNEVNSGTKAMQSFADEYRRKVNPGLWVHAADLQGYGTRQFAGDRTNFIAGWSEKLLEFILLSEQGVGTLVKRVADYDIFIKAA